MNQCWLTITGVLWHSPRPISQYLPGACESSKQFVRMMVTVTRARRKCIGLGHVEPSPVAAFPTKDAVCLTSYLLKRRILDHWYRRQTNKTIVAASCQITWAFGINTVHIHSTWWRHQMETFYSLLALCVGNSPVNSPHKGQWRGVFIFSLICAWINGWVNNREAGDMRHHHAHYDVIVMMSGFF